MGAQTKPPPEGRTTPCWIARQGKKKTCHVRSCSRILFSSGMPETSKRAPAKSVPKSAVADSSSSKAASQAPSWELRFSRHDAAALRASGVSRRLRPTESSRSSPLTGCHVPSKC
ncbi:hypothetical protein NDU88_004037 [Pleurodeles waltl]|uniref:Uncharacterized protein n=1 Tax=Pleurodeles waltl TaxID=8319 RepID=A0AAV7W3T7_PLEWA|nr:hypothetical protein NDU88_004037 [Pleurodeles waltl]